MIKHKKSPAGGQQRGLERKNSDCSIAGNESLVKPYYDSFEGMRLYNMFHYDLKFGFQRFLKSYHKAIAEHILYFQRYYPIFYYPNDRIYLFINFLNDVGAINLCGGKEYIKKILGGTE